MEEDKMARFCAKCGKQLGEQAAFCPACGAKVSRSENQQMQMNPQAPVKVHKNKTSRNLLAIAMVIVVLIVGVFGIKSLVSPGYMRPIKLVEKDLMTVMRSQYMKACHQKQRRFWRCPDVKI